jgi:hypothetical protein
MLRMSHPIKAEADFEDDLWIKHEIARLAESGAPLTEGYTVRKASLVSGGDHVFSVYQREQHGRTWRGAIPDDALALPTIDVPRMGRLAALRLRNTVLATATRLTGPSLAATAEPMTGVLIELQPLRTGAGDGASIEALRRVLDAAVDREAIGLVKRLACRIFPMEVMGTPESALLPEFEADLLKEYSRLLVSGYAVSALLLLCALSQAAAPIQPIRHAFEAFAGRSEDPGINDVICRVVMKAPGTAFIAGAAEALSAAGHAARNLTKQAKNIDHFFHAQYLALPFSTPAGSRITSSVSSAGTPTTLSR